MQIVANDKKSKRQLAPAQVQEGRDTRNVSDSGKDWVSVDSVGTAGLSPVWAVGQMTLRTSLRGSWSKLNAGKHCDVVSHLLMCFLPNSKAVTGLKRRIDAFANAPRLHMRQLHPTNGALKHSIAQQSPQGYRGPGFMDASPDYGRSIDRSRRTYVGEDSPRNNVAA